MRPRAVPLAENPISQLFDSAAMQGGTMPPPDELDRVAELVSPGNPARVRSQLRATCDQIVAASRDGNSGEARSIGREAAIELVNSLPDYHHPDPDAGKPMRQIVEESYKDW